MNLSYGNGDTTPTTHTCAALGMALAGYLPPPLLAQIKRFSLDRDRGGRFLPMQDWETIGVEARLDELVREGLLLKGMNREYRLSTAGAWLRQALVETNYTDKVARLVYSAPEPVSKLEDPARSWWRRLTARRNG